MANYELRLKLLYKRWMGIQALRDEQKKLKDEVRPMLKRIRSLGQQIGRELDEYNEVVK